MLCVDVSFLDFIFSVQITFNDANYKIGGKGEWRCKIEAVRMYDLVFIGGSKIPVGKDTILKFEVMSDGSSCLKGNDSRITTTFTKTPHPNHPKYEDIEMVISFSDIQCDDADSFECGIEGPDIERVNAFFGAIRELFYYYN